MQLETRFLRLKIPVAVGSYFGGWRVTWAGGWTRHKLSYLVMVARVVSPASQPARIASTTSRGMRSSSSSPAASRFNDLQENKSPSPHQKFN